MNHNFNLPVNSKKRIIIIGAGFAGLKLARKLANSKYQVVVIDKQNYHQFQPLFYQVAASGIEPSSISFPVRKAFHEFPNLHFRNTLLLEVDTAKSIIKTTAGELRYDFLVIATGVNTNYFGNANIQKYALPMKSTSEAIYLRNRILETFEAAILSTSKVGQEKLLSVAVVGGGPTGVELSGAIAELRSFVLEKDYPELDFSLMKIRLYEAGPRLLNGMSENAGTKAVKFLEKINVEIHLNTPIADYDGETITLGDKSTLACKNLIWSAGVTGKQIQGLDNSVYTRGSRMVVDRNNKVLNTTNIFAIGDIAYMETEKYPKGHPQVAQVAIQQARVLAMGLIKNKWYPFEYNDKGSMATIGRKMAVVDLPKLKFSGTLAWFIWLFVHLMSIVGVKNRLFIFINWASSYFSRDQSLRIIIKPFLKT